MTIAILGIDLGKTMCSLVKLHDAGAVVLRRRMRRATVTAQAAKLPRRMHRNDLENIPALLAAGLLFAAAEPPLWLAGLLFTVFVLARLAHTWPYAAAQNHEVGASVYSVGSVVVMLMASWVLVVAVL